VCRVAAIRPPPAIDAQGTMLKILGKIWATRSGPGIFRPSLGTWCGAIAADVPSRPSTTVAFLRPGVGRPCGAQHGALVKERALHLQHSRHVAVYALVPAAPIRVRRERGIFARLLSRATDEAAGG
jgi:hypothetical protein